MTLRPKLLFCDVDRTLLTHGHELLPSVIGAVGAAQEAGIHIVLASARSPSGAAVVHSQLGLAGPAICFNGAWIGSLEPNRPWHSCAIERELALSVFGEARAAGMPAMWYGADRVQAIDAHANVAHRQAAVTGDKLEIVRNFDGLSGAPFKLMVAVPQDQVHSAFAHLSVQFGDSLSIVRSGPGLIEIVRKGINKATAAGRVADLLGLVPDHCAAAGDSENDLELLRWAGLPLTVANGVDEARRLAHFVGGHCDAGGLSDVLNWMISLPHGQPFTGGSASDLTQSETRMLPTTGKPNTGETK